MRHATVSLVALAAIAAVPGFLGFGVEHRLQPASTVVPGTESERGELLLERAFGRSNPFVIALRGPVVDLRRQRSALVSVLRGELKATVFSPAGGAALGGPRLSPRTALIAVELPGSAEHAVRRLAPRLNRVLQTHVHPPVRAVQTGVASLSRAVQDESAASTRTAELIAIPILVVVLLFVFRSPFAALIPLGLGAVTVLAARGVLALVSSQVEIDAFALTVCSMMGLALGVDYTLLMVSRFREELAAGATPVDAAWRARGTAGRTIVFAGLTLILAMVVTLWVMPGNLFLSLAGAAILVTTISIGVAYFAAPSLLALLGDRIDRWRLPSRESGRRLMGLVSVALRRPRWAAAAIGAALLLLAAPALGLKTGPPSLSQLSTSNSAREDAEAINRAIGPGWDAPFVLVAASGKGPIASGASLAALKRAQREIAADPGVQAVIGPEQIARTVKPLRRGANDLLAGRGDVSATKLTRLGDNLDRAAGGVGRFRTGLLQATDGAGLLADGSSRAGRGAVLLANGIAKVASSAEGAAGALGRLDRSSGKLAEAQRNLALGSRSLRDELTGLLPVLRGAGLRRARRLSTSLRQAASADPDLGGEARQAELLVEALTLARNQAKRAHAFASRLHNGQVVVAKGGARLHGGAGRLAEAADSFPGGLRRLDAGATQLARGIQSLGGGAHALQRNLASGFHASRPLEGGLARAGDRVAASASHLSSQLRTLRRTAPRIFDSGYFALAALDGAAEARRQRAGLVIDLDHGGHAAKFLVVPRSTFNTPGSEALYGRLKQEAASLAASTGFETGVTGGPAELADYSSAISDRIPLVVLAITVVTFLILVLVLRALPVAAIAVALNLLTVAVAFGVLTLLFDVPAGWPLGGHTYVDAIGAAGIFGIVFGLSIDYAVFLLSRMRESHEAGATNEEAIAFGLRRTARVITGAAAIMLTVFVAFAAAPIATVSQLGTGLAVAVALDATVVRIVLLPALMLIIGERVWWLPRVLDRALPKLGFHPA